MDLPKRTRQKKAEAHSYAVLLYKLRDLGIFRNLTDNDYGIDFELELVTGDTVTGRTVKIQVKSAENLRVRNDGTPSVGGIKQSTLAYWCELGFRTNVMAYAVDLATETIYVSRNLFWEATKKIDGGTSSKSISFFAADAAGDQAATALTLMHALAPSAADQVYAHTLALRRLKDFLALMHDADAFDPGSELHEPEHFRDLLEASFLLLWIGGEALWTDPKDRKHWAKVDYWKQKSEADDWDGLVYFAVRDMLGILVPALVEQLRKRKSLVLAGRYYWAHRNPQYLQLVYETAIPGADDKTGLLGWLDDHDFNARGPGDWVLYLTEARKPKAPKPKKLHAKASTSTKTNGKAGKRGKSRKSS